VLLAKEPILARRTGARLQKMDFEIPRQGRGVARASKSREELEMNETPASEGFLIRQARVEDAPVIAWHRARMFQDMGELSPAAFEELRKQTEIWTESALSSGEYIGWLGIPKTRPDVIAGGAGIQLRRVAPHPCRPPRDGAIAKGRHAIVLNVFTEPEWRRRGLALLLMQELIRWVQDEQLDRLVLHASAEARPLYERLGFVLTNEMRFAGE
jgi:GNAT superfamily N-acetyltransferase